MQDLPDASQHPDYPREKRHLEDTLRTIGELETILEDLINRRASFGSISAGYDLQDRVVEAFLRQGRSGELAQLQSVEGRPYFGRYDFRKQGGSGSETYYIGRVGINEFRKCDQLGTQYVIDWRSPVGQGFYNIADRKTRFTTPGGSVAGEVLLKRQFDIEGGRLLGIVDEGALSEKLRADPFLQRVLQKGATQKLKDIVATIQREQDTLIRQPLNKTLLVQGVAGSGKTTIGLHRISYLLYRYRDSLKPEKIAFIAPSKVFLDYISDVLPGIDAAGIRQLTIRELFADLIDAGVKKKRTGKTEPPFRQVSATVPAAHEERLLYMKGTLAYRDAIRAFCREWEKGCAATLQSFRLKIIHADIVIDGGKLGRILADTQTPLNIRLNNLTKSVKRSARTQIASQLGLYVVGRRRRGSDGKNSGSADEHQSDLPQEYTQALAKFAAQPPLAGWAKIDAVRFYVEFLHSDAYRSLCASRGLSAAADPAGTQPDASDEDALAYIHILLNGVPQDKKFGQLVLDEAQDCSPLAISLLREFSANGSITLLGDLNQNSRSIPWHKNWAAVAEGAFAGMPAECIELTTSYRSVGEIVSFTNRLLPPDAAKAVPVYFGEESPQIYTAATLADAVQRIALRVKELIGADCKSIGIVTRNQAEADKLYKELLRLPKPLPAAVQLVDESVTEFRGGVSVLPVHMAKGLEFEAVIIANAGEEQYPGQSIDRRLLYIACTRALHHLDVLYTGKLSPLLAAENPADAGDAF